MEYDEFFKNHLCIICLMKIFHDSGNMIFETVDRNSPINDSDYYYEYIITALQNLAPIIRFNEGLYEKYDAAQEEDQAWAYSCKEMEKYFKIARKLYRIEGCKEKKNPYLDKIYKDAEQIRNFYSYCFTYNFGSLRKHPQLEVVWDYEFQCELYMCIWVMRVIEIFKKELPILQAKYRKARREKRIKKVGERIAAK